MEMLPGDVPLPNRSVLKRSASTASLPTPPRTHRRRKRGCSHGVHNSESNNLGDQDSELSSSDEGGAEFPRSDQRSHKKRRLSLSSGGDDNEEAFWLAGPKSEARCRRDLDQEHLSDTNKDEGVHADDFSSVVPLLYRKPLKRSHSEASNGLASPPPSHRKPQLQALATLSAGVPESSSTAVLPVSQPVSPPRHRRNGQVHERALNHQNFQSFLIHPITLFMWFQVHPLLVKKARVRVWIAGALRHLLLLIMRSPL